MKTNLLNKKLLCGIILLLFVTLFAFLITNGYFNLDRDVKIYSADAVDIIDQRMNSLLSEVNIFPQYVGDDLIFLSRLSSLKKVISSKESNKNIISDLENDFVAFIKQSTIYYQLGYIDKEGKEIVRVEFKESIYKILSQGDLENKKEEDYFSETINFDEGEIFVSQIILNIEDGEIENRGTKENPIYFPIILSATPVFNDNGEKTGVLFLSLEADYFLGDIRNFQRPGEDVFLINEKGYYLAHPDRKKEFAFLVGRDDSIYNDFPEISKEIIFDYNKRRFETDNLIFSFRYIYPIAGGFGINKGSEKIFGESPEESYFWVLVSVSDKNEINKTINELKKEYIYFLLFSGVIALIIIILVFIAIFKGFENGDFKRRK